MKRMSKMEAVGLLCEIKKKIEQDITYHSNAIKKSKDDISDPEHSPYHTSELLKYQSWTQALEMAGKAMTR